MKKKMKDITFGEMMKQCDEIGLNRNHDKDCRHCPFYNYCGKHSPQIMPFIKRDLNYEVEIK